MNGRHSVNEMAPERISDDPPGRGRPRRVLERPAGELDAPLTRARRRDRRQHGGGHEPAHPAGRAGADPVDVIAGLERRRRAADRGCQIRLCLERAQPLRGDLASDQDDADRYGQRARGDRDERQIGQDPALEPHSAATSL